jgi:hypothetical protein
MHRLLILTLCFFVKFSYSQIEIDWSTLADVEFTDVYMEEEDEYFLYPHFGMNVQELAGKQVVIREMKSKKDVFIMDEVATMKGTLKLNSDDIYQCNYILQNAEVYLR